MKFYTMNIPTEAKRENETNEETFLRIVDTFMGEYPTECIEIKDKEDMSALGKWVIKNDKRFPSKSFPVSWFEDDNENITEYFVYMDNKRKCLRHIIVDA